ncbi:hypothetical protein [Nonomuraea sp. NPDC049625]|uniref:hypothetical protein n=1 Tax=Nonomuraea sp. NPDC049625 TaxID=3155775 RepID=UPI0034478F93
MTEEPLTGGNNALEVVRAGDTVRRVRDVETANLGDPALPPARRRHAEAAVAWATADRAFVRRHQALLDALR